MSIANPSEPVPADVGWTVEKQAAVVLRLLTGESLEAMSRETGVPPDELDTWRRVVLRAAAAALRKYGRRLRKEAARELRRRRAAPDRSEFEAVPPKDPNAAMLPVPQHLHLLWTALGLDDE
jgi:hypothetical protein